MEDESEDILMEECLSIIENQIVNNEPKETKKTLNRLIFEGYEKEEAKLMLANCIAVEIFDVIKNGKTFNQLRYALNLSNLPKEPKS